MAVGSYAPTVSPTTAATPITAIPNGFVSDAVMASRERLGSSPFPKTTDEASSSVYAGLEPSKTTVCPKAGQP